jgi:uncharacterized membrane protein HdeD (DUF308 family)
MTMASSIKDDMQKSWKVLLAGGIIMMITGVLALAAPGVATLAVDLYVGWLMIIGGIAGIAALASGKRLTAFPWALFTAILSIIVGGLLVWKPMEGALSLTIVVAAFFVVEGVYQSAASIAYKDLLGSTWGWLLVSGLADLALAVLIGVGWPSSAGWALGVLVGVSLLTSGWAIMMAALAAKQLTTKLLPGNMTRGAY